MSRYLEPVLDRIVVQRDALDNVTKGGIHLPGNKFKESKFGKVMAVGPGGYNIDGTIRPMPVAVGDQIFFTDEFYCTEFGKDRIAVIDVEGVIAIVRDDDG